MRTAILLVTAATACLLAAGAAWACSCLRYDSAAEQLAQADLMFVGRVTSTLASGPQDGVTRFEVLRTLKGQSRDVVEIRHVINDGGATCGVEFAVGQTVPVIAYDVDGRLQTNLCSMPQFPLEDYEALQGESG